MTAHAVVLKVHLWMGLAAAIFLVILGLTGSIMAFENDIDHWVHPARWYVKAGAKQASGGVLVRGVEQIYTPLRVAVVEVGREPNLAWRMQMTDGSQIFIDPYSGVILERVRGVTGTQKFLGFVHQVHLRLVGNPGEAPKTAAVGKVIVSIAGLLLWLLVPTGLVLWWRTRRASIEWKSSWFRVCFDAHHAIGIYAALFLWIAAFTGILIGFDFGERAIYAVTRSSNPNRQRLPQSTATPATVPIPLEQALETARDALPGATVAGIFLPLSPNAAFHVLLRVPEETSEAVHSMVSEDQYSGKVLQVRNFLTDSVGYRVIRFNRSIHTGDIWGLPSHILVSISSLLLVAMVVTGLVIWWKKLAI